MHESCAAHFQHVSEAGLACVQDLIQQVPRGGGGGVLLVGQRRSAIKRKLMEAGLRVSRWDRFSVGRKGGTMWPSSSMDVVASIISVPAGTEWLDMNLCAVSAILPPGSPVYGHGLAEDRPMLLGCRRLHAGQLLDFDTKRDVGHQWDVASPTCAMMISRNAAPCSRSKPLDWKRIQDLEHAESISPKFLQWTTWPGFFAAGLVDVMTNFLLDNLPEVPPGSTVLDWASGSGVIAKTVLL